MNKHIRLKTGFDDDDPNKRYLDIRVIFFSSSSNPNSKRTKNSFQGALSFWLFTNLKISFCYSFFLNFPAIVAKGETSLKGVLNSFRIRI